MTVFYEWQVELVQYYPDDPEPDLHDIIDQYPQETFAECMKFIKDPPDEPHQKWDIVLVRNNDTGRSWAYLEDGVMSTHFEDAYGREVSIVPKRFLAEVIKYHESKE